MVNPRIKREAISTLITVSIEFPFNIKGIRTFGGVLKAALFWQTPDRAKMATFNLILLNHLVIQNLLFVSFWFDIGRLGKYLGIPLKVR